MRTLAALCLFNLLAPADSLRVHAKDAWDDKAQSRIPPHAWSIIGRYPAPRICEANERNVLKLEDIHKVGAEAPCPIVGGQYTRLVTKDRHKWEQFKKYVCSAEADFWGNDVGAELSLEVTDLQGGCVYMPPSNLNLGEGRRFFNSTHFHNVEFTRSSVLDLASIKTDTVDQDLFVTPYAHFEQMYPHVLMDFLPQVWASMEYIKENNLKVLSRTPLETQMLLRVGVSQKNIHNMQLANKVQHALCVSPSRSMHFLDIKGGWHRQLSYRVGHELALAANEHNKVTETKPAVVFVRRCGGTHRKPIQNERRVLDTIKRVMQEQGRTEELVDFCGDLMDTEDQINVFSRATTIIGQHGGAMANLLFSKASCDTTVIEFVGDETTAHGGQTPYKSFFYGGMASPFTYKLVQYDALKDGSGFILNIPDLEEALAETWGSNRPPERETITWSK